MRIEIDYNFLIYLSMSLVFLWLFLKTNVPIKLFKILFVLNVALIMPSFIPGHGEVVMLLPTGALFSVLSNEVKFLGVLFTLINYGIIWYMLYKLIGLFKNKI